jgi:hypothetical protein
MKKRVELLLMVLALAGIYCGVSKSAERAVNPRLGAEQIVLVADGSDPMPLCRGKACK